MLFRIQEIIGKYAISSSSGQKVFELIRPALLAGTQVELDFCDVKVFASPFFNFAIRQLLRDLSIDDFNRLLSFTALNDNGQLVLKQVIANAKRYYSNPQYRGAVDIVLEEYAASF